MPSAPGSLVKCDPNVHGPDLATIFAVSPLGAGIVPRFDGSYCTMLRNDAYWFSRLGVYVERADNTARILDVKYHLAAASADRWIYFQWAAIRGSVSALTAYHWVYCESLKPWLVADLLILRDEMPRSRPVNPLTRPSCAIWI